MGEGEMLKTIGIVDRLSREVKTNGLKLCHWKSNQRLALSVEGKTDLDMSIPSDQETEFRLILSRLGFVEFLSRPWNRYVGVSDWLGMDSATGTMLHLHLHTRLLTGLKAVKEQDLPWLEMMNESIYLDPATDIYIPQRAFEAHLLLTREAIKSLNIRGRLISLHDRVPVSNETRNEMSWLLDQCSPDELNGWGERLWGAERWARMQPFFFNKNLWEERTFLQLRKEIAASLCSHRFGNFVSNSAKFILMRALSYVHSIRARLIGTTPSGKHMVASRAPIIAVVGSDGAGKSTVITDLRRWLSWKADVCSIYFGTNHRWFRTLRSLLLPLTGKKKISGDAEKNRCPEPSTRSTFPAWLQPFKWVIMARVRLHMLRKTQILSKQGTIVLGDRYPQSEVFGIFDGPSQPNASGLGFLGKWLQQYEHYCYKCMSKIHPDLIIKLVVPLDVALARKPDHSPELIAEKINLTRSLKFGGVTTVEVDASLPIDTVLLEVRNHVWDVVSRMAKE